MAKVDATRNYYADLGVPAHADENEIRKAFRQLALKCHPDRNPGRENEYVAKFQQIQSAHEILSDPLQRAKYDVERRKFRNLSIPPYNPTTPRSRPPPAPRNAYTSTPNGSYYRAPPPKPPQPSPQRPPPPQHHSTYSNGADRFTSKNFRAPPTARRPPPEQEAANVFTAWQKMKQPRGEEQKAQNTNNPNGTPFGRSKTTRVPSSKKGFDPGMPGQDEGQARSAYRSHYERPNPSPNLAEDVPFAEGNRVRTPYHSAAGERTSMFGQGVDRSASVRNSPTHGSRSTSSKEPGFYSDSERRSQRNSYGGHSKKSQPFPHMYESSTDEEYTSGGKHRGPPPPNESPQQQPAWAFRTEKKSTPANGTPPNPFKSKSEESINMKFSPSDWHGKFEGKPDYFAPNLQKGNLNKGRTSPSRGRPVQRTATEKTRVSGQSQPPPPVSPFSQQYPTEMPPPPPGPPPNAQTAFHTRAAPASHNTKFKPEAWAETFKEPSWAYPSKETSPRRGSTTTKRPNPSRKPSVVPEGSAKTSQSDRSKPKHQAFAEDVINGDEDAMDIDDTPPAAKATSAPTKSSPSSKSTGTAPGLNGLSGLTNVAPFLPSGDGGLAGLDALKDNLPFKSQPSDVHPTKPNKAQKLKFPTVPSAPLPPLKLNEASADFYFTQMEGYVRQYKAYCEALTKHFAGRNAELEDLDDRFIHHRGETTKKLGFTSYLKKMKEDEEVMVVWKLAQEMHIKAMEQCGEVRNKMKQYSFSV
ncbi:hypothetical protein K458DRAFT_99057 [Lentithecium fluviatile CBS 122367]|uniref:J domain-containing protein n=1 Tax=Lentithecium fluviatile CBS 122367 TaxID=1168545 RepID=A0A6G1JJ08_9PLEO|nr:hypothetical protein K458DRAFT_99057 [Lentithecium fluviatile CBS 122367]